MRNKNAELCIFLRKFHGVRKKMANARLSYAVAVVLQFLQESGYENTAIALKNETYEKKKISDSV